MFDRENIPHLLTKDEVKTLYDKNLIMHHKWTDISKSIPFEIHPRSIKWVVTEVERRADDSKNNQFKYNECPIEIINIIPENYIEEESECDNSSQSYSYD